MGPLRQDNISKNNKYKNGYSQIEELSKYTKITKIPQMKLSAQKIDQLLPYFKSTFLKSCVADTAVQTILQNAQVIQPQIHTNIFMQGDRIEQYYFLVKGIVGLYKNVIRQQTKDNQSDQFQIVQAGRVIGQYFNSLHTLREYSTIVKDQQTQIIKIDKKLFDSMCQSLIYEYNQVDKYAKNSLYLIKKINSFDVFTVRKYRLGSQIRLDGQIAVILKGQCKILLNCKQSTDKSPMKSNLPSIVQPKSRLVMKQISLVGQNQWIFTENLQQEKINKFKYVITSQKLSLLALPVAQVDILPASKVSNLKRICNERKQRVTVSQRNAVSIQNERLASNSPRIMKKKMDDAHKILQKLDANISPVLILQKYKLGYNAIRYQNHERKDRNSVAAQLQMMRKQKTQRRLQQRYFKVKDWSQYVKLPNSKF